MKCERRSGTFPVFVAVNLYSTIWPTPACSVSLVNSVIPLIRWTWLKLKLGAPSTLTTSSFDSALRKLYPPHSTVARFEYSLPAVIVCSQVHSTVSRGFTAANGPAANVRAARVLKVFDSERRIPGVSRDASVLDGFAGYSLDRVRGEFPARTLKRFDGKLTCDLDRRESHKGAKGKQPVGQGPFHDIALADFNPFTDFSFQFWLVGVCAFFREFMVAGKYDRSLRDFIASGCSEVFAAGVANVRNADRRGKGDGVDADLVFGCLADFSGAEESVGFLLRIRTDVDIAKRGAAPLRNCGLAPAASCVSCVVGRARACATLVHRNTITMKMSMRSARDVPPPCPPSPASRRAKSRPPNTRVSQRPCTYGLGRTDNPARSEPHRSLRRQTRSKRGDS